MQAADIVDSKLKQVVIKSILVISVLLLSVINGRSSTIIQEYSFDRPELIKVKIADQIYDRVIMPGVPNYGEIGQPSLPSFGVRILLPFKSEVSSIEVLTGEKTVIGAGYFIEPVEKPFILSAAPNDLDNVFLDSITYSQTTPFPANRYEKIGVQYFRGYQILVLNIFPLEYTPADGSVSYYKDLTVKVNSESSDKLFPALRNTSTDEAEVIKWIDNISAVDSYSTAVKMGRAEYDMLIITLPQFVNAFMPLKEYHDTTGVITEIHTLDMIGASDPHSVRNYIRQEYLNNGIEYVVIGADDDFIPALDMYVVSWEGTTGITEYDMPGDIYFSCLDGTFNYDNDTRWGEPTDGEDGGDIDLFPDVYVGRFGARSSQEVSNLVNKTLAYLGSESSYLQKVLLSGEQLGFGGLGEYGGYAMDEMVNYSDAHGFLTFAFPETEYEIDKLYDILSLSANYWPASQMIARMNAGVHIIDHLGHSDNGYAMRTDTLMIKNQLANTDYFFIYAEGCNAGKFDITDCWAEYMTTKLPNGAFGCIANSRIGLGSRSTAHPVHIFNREFWDAIYSGEEAKPELGRALAEARIDHAYHINSPGVRWNYYEINLFGDPAIKLKSVQSLAISFPDDVPERILPYEETSFNVQVTGIGTGTAVQGSGQLHYCINQGGWETADMEMLSPNLYKAVLPPLGCTSTIAFYVSAEEEGGELHYSPDPAHPISLSPIADSVILFADDFETDRGWLISGGLWARGVPAGLGGEELNYPVPDPTEGCNGPKVMGYNLNGDYENNLPITYVISPEFDCSDRDNVHLKFYRWLGVEQYVYDKVNILISIDGVDWTEIWRNNEVIADLKWQPIEFDISDIAANQKSVYAAWVMGPTDGGLHYIGWNIDDVRIVSYTCQGFLCGDASDDGNVNLLDLTYLINYLYKGGTAPNPIALSDVDNSGAINILDVTYLINYLYKNGPQPDCP
ncbi:MAG: hypothetical protein CVT49_07480 [candidate division Zixibacteria bacterium HGW-Zixibacteria-1]|nr:MAG: hypothetical protein CVT49_07480 [candidate division Zixibacteria bacterium HGW-Zixibacteria-1]